MITQMDGYREQGLRKALIKELRTKGIHDERILEAFDAVPRHHFLDSAFLEMAYENKAFPIGSGQTISHPYTVAFQTQLLEIEKGHKILEIGTGSAFQTAILVKMGAKVFSIERHKPLYKKAKVILAQLGLRAMLMLGDGFKGSQVNGPFDSIIVTCGAPFIPQELCRQLKDGGRMIIPVGELDEQKMKRIWRKGNELEVEELGVFSFVPMLPNIVRN
ncbi:MAG: protein-L-isoaspartate(D-aspartate) O-methyltransferase [Bacteroidota bacterium]